MLNSSVKSSLFTYNGTSKQGQTQKIYTAVGDIPRCPKLPNQNSLGVKTSSFGIKMSAMSKTQAMVPGNGPSFISVRPIYGGKQQSTYTSLLKPPTAAPSRSNISMMASSGYFNYPWANKPGFGSSVTAATTAPMNSTPMPPKTIWGCVVQPPKNHSSAKTAATANRSTDIKMTSIMKSNSNPKNVDESLSAQEMINGNKVIIFSKEYCPHCTQAINMLIEANINFTVIQLDKRTNGQQIQDQLAEMSGQKTVPNIYIAGKHLGGCNDLMQDIADGEFAALLDGEYIEHNLYDII